MPHSALSFPHEESDHKIFVPSWEEHRCRQSLIQQCFLRSSTPKGGTDPSAENPGQKNKCFLQADQHRVAVNTLSTALVAWLQEQGIYLWIWDGICSASSPCCCHSRSFTSSSFPADILRQLSSLGSLMGVPGFWKTHL